MLTKLDNFLLKCAQWVVDRIGGDYIGQRIGRQIGYMSCIGYTIFVCIDYRMPPGWAAIISFVWMINAFFVHWWTKQAITSIYRGYANPVNDYAIVRIFLVSFSVGQFLGGVIHPELIQGVRTLFYALFGVAVYLISTENPPPKKVKQEDDVALPNVAPQES